jgi:hypothetical protein
MGMDKEDYDIQANVNTFSEYEPNSLSTKFFKILLIN